MNAREGMLAVLCAALAASCGAGPSRGKGTSASPGSGEVRPAPGEKGVATVAPEVPAPTPEERAAAEQLFDSVNSERAARALPKLAWAADLAAVGRGYCAEMARTGVIAHESPISGGPADRATRAGVAFVRLTENLALAPDAPTAHEGLMRSPGHRANILDDGVTEMGVGAVFAIKDGTRSLIVAQMFAAPPEHIDPATAGDDLAARLNAARKAGGLAPFSRHKWLDAKAKDALGSCTSGAIAEGGGAEEQPPFRLITVVVARGGAIAQIADGLAGKDQPRSPLLTHFGVAVKQIDGSGTGVCAVVMFGAKR